MRKRSFALVMISIGAFLIAFSIGSMLTNFSSYPSITVLGVVGAIIFVIGLLLFVTELIENWLTKGQTALVDGLQAG